MQLNEAFSQRQRRIGANDAVGDVTEAIAIDRDHPPSGVAQSWIDTDQSHGHICFGPHTVRPDQALSRSMISSEMS